MQVLMMMKNHRFSFSHALVSVLVSFGCAAEVPDGGDARTESLVGGVEVAQCAFPSVVSVGGGCTGTLVTPSVVVTAEHCRSGMRAQSNGTLRSTVGFGERQGRLDQVGATCVPVPQTGGQRSDTMFCALDEEVDYPTTPIAYGCEVDAELRAGREVTLVGFGLTSFAARRSGGIKRWTQTTIQELVIDSQGQRIERAPDGTPASSMGVALIGTPSNSACPGDSGGPAFIRLADGSYRVFGNVSGGTTGIPCNGDGAYPMLHQHVPWFETTFGIDVTPCHDTDGTWNPGPGCQGFHAGTAAGGGNPRLSCSDEPVSGPSATCGAPIGGTTPPPPPPPAADTVRAQVEGTLSAGQIIRYRPIAAAPGSSFRVSIEGTGDADLYVRVGAAPDFETFDCRPYTDGSNEACDIVVGASGQVHVMVHGFTPSSFSLDAEWTPGS